MAPHHRSPLEPPNLQVKAALMEAEVEAVTDGMETGVAAAVATAIVTVAAAGNSGDKQQSTTCGGGRRRWRRRWGEVAVKGGGQRQ
jgi:hypothetical protein